MRYRFGETVTIHPYSAGEVDDYGNQVEGFGEPIERPRCAVAPRVEVEEIDNNRAMVVNGFTIYDAFDSPVGPRDELTVRGIRCKVDGEIARWSNPYTGRKPGCVITVKRVDG